MSVVFRCTILFGDTCASSWCDRSRAKMTRNHPACSTTPPFRRETAETDKRETETETDREREGERGKKGEID